MNLIFPPSSISTFIPSSASSVELHIEPVLSFAVNALSIFALNMANSFPPPNYVNPESIGWRDQACAIVTIIAAICFVVARILTKLFITHAPGWDDCMSCVSKSANKGPSVLTSIHRHLGHRFVFCYCSNRCRD